MESNETEVAKTLNEFLSNIVKNLEILEYQCEDNLHSRLSSNPVLQAIMKYRHQPSISIIRRYSQRFPSFYFSVIDKNTVLKEIRNLSVKKAIQDTNIPIKVFKENEKCFAEQIYLQFNEGISASHFPFSRNLKDNYRHVALKVFEKLMCKQLSNHFDNIFLKFQCGFRKTFGAQHCLLSMIDKLKRAANNNKFFGAIITGLLKAFDYICHDLLNLHACKLSLRALKMIQDYLLNQKQRIKSGSSYSTWENIYFFGT